MSIFWIIILWSFVGYFLAAAFIFIQFKKIEALEDIAESLDTKLNTTDHSMKSFFKKEKAKTERSVRYRQIQIIIAGILAGPFYWIRIIQLRILRPDKES